MLTNQRWKRGNVIAGGERSVTLGESAPHIIVRKQMVVFVQTVMADETKAILSMRITLIKHRWHNYKGFVVNWKILLSSSQTGFYFF